MRSKNIVLGEAIKSCSSSSDEDPPVEDVVPSMRRLKKIRTRRRQLGKRSFSATASLKRERTSDASRRSHTFDSTPPCSSGGLGGPGSFHTEGLVSFPVGFLVTWVSGRKGKRREKSAAKMERGNKKRTLPWQQYRIVRH